MRASRQNKSIVKMVEISVLTAIALILQLVAIGAIPFLKTAVNLSLIPIALGAILYGPKCGAWLGLITGAEIALVGGVWGIDAFTALLFNQHPFLTFVLCLVKTGLAGVVAGVVYNVLKKKNEYLGIFAASVVVPIVNTATFILGCLFMSGTMSDVSQKFFGNELSSDFGTQFYFILISLVGINFVFEFIISSVCVPALRRIISVIRKEKR